MKLRKALALALAIMMLVSVLPMDAAAKGSTIINPVCDHSSKTYSGSSDCVNSAWVVWFCNNCQASGQSYFPPLGHIWDVGHVKAATCTEGGWTQYVCARCGAYNTTDFTDPLGHDMGPWYDVVAATPGHPGKQQSDCSRGDYSETRDTYADDTTPTDPTIPTGPVDPPVYPDVNVQLVLTLNNLPACGFFTNDKRVADFKCTLFNDSAFELENLIIEFPGRGTNYTESANFGTLGSWSTQSVYISNHTVLPAISHFTGPCSETQTATASFTVDGVPFTVTSNTVLLPADNLWGQLQISLNIPTTPARGFFVENEIVTVPATITAVGGNVYNVSWWTSEPDPQYVGSFDLKEGESYSRDLTFRITGADCVNEYHTLYTTAQGLNDELELTYAALDVTVPCGIIGLDDPKEDLRLTVHLDSHPDNGWFFVEGDIVKWTYVVHDTGVEPFAGEFNLVQSKPDSQTFSNQWTATCSHVVTAHDVEEGYFSVWGELFFTTGDLENGYRYADLFPQCGVETQHDISISKTVISTPANGFYVPGEWVAYLIDVTNNGNAFENVWVEDPALSLAFPAALYPGQTYRRLGTYQITNPDADAESFTNTAWAEISWDGGSLRRYASATVPTGHGVLTPSISIYKMLDPGCKPSKGSRFQEGDTLSYNIIVTNNGSEPFYNVTVYDDRDTGFMYYIGTMNPSDIWVTPFYSTVTKKDCGMKWALNTASVGWMDEEATSHSMTSNTVAVPAGDYTSVLTGHSACNRTILAAGEGAWQYQQDYCSVHGAVRQDAETVSAAEAAGLWKDAVNQLYEDWFDAVEGEKLTAARADRDAFFTMLDAFEAVANNPELAARILEDKCTELCNELYSDPDEPCAASWNTEGLTDLDEPHGEYCSALWESQDSGSALLTEVCCETHNERLNRMLQSGVIEGVENLQWETLRVSSRVVLKSVYKQLFGDNEQGASVACTAFTAYLEQHGQTLSLYRELSESDLAEAFSRSIVNHITMLCSTQS